MKVFFLGNHTVGVRSLEAILETDEVVGVAAHPPDAEDGVRYLSVYDYARARGLSVQRFNGRDPSLLSFVQQSQPELLWVADYRYILPVQLIAAAPAGAVNLHPSLLPKYRGRAPINWAIINGEKQLGLTAHYLEAGMDTGDIIEQIRYQLEADQDVGDALEILYPLYRSITRSVLGKFRSGLIQRRPQDHRLATSFPARKPEDGLIDWEQSARRVRDLVRAVAKPYPGAYSYLSGKKILIWKVADSDRKVPPGIPGEVIAHHRRGPLVRTGRGALIVSRAEDFDSGKAAEISVGDCFSPGG